MDLPVQPPVEPMLATSKPEIPTGDLSYEPKWDGFRILVFRDGDEVELASRGGKSMTRYFPEVVEAIKANTPPKIVLDGEIVTILPGDGGSPPKLDFDTLSQRIHPAASRVKMLSETTPASFVAFDLLALGSDDLMASPFVDRRRHLETALKDAKPPVYVTPITEDPAVARGWFSRFEGAGLDGLIAKPNQSPYTPAKRSMYKIKHQRTADVVVTGFRWHKSGPVVGSLLLGLYDDGGELHHIGVTASFTAKRRKELLDELAPYRDPKDHPWLRKIEEFTGESGHDLTRMPGGVTRWNSGKDLSWEALAPELVVEVAFGHMEGTRIRHTATFVRWRPDRTPESCTYAQLDRPIKFNVNDVLSPSTPGKGDS